MASFLDLSQYGYQISGELGRNREGGRITWQGVFLDTNQPVVIKQFCFASNDSSWSGYQAYEREIQLLKRLNHPGIPRYLGSIETDSGFCLIQEDKQALSLANKHNFTLEEIKTIIVKILEILVYLQQQIPPIFHRDIKPENILIDEKLNVYLVDFGFASLGSKEATASSIFKGTPGFIAPEQIIQPTKASDIYSLGVTIICLLTDKNALELQALAKLDNPYKLEFKSLLPNLNRKFIDWLEKMVQPQTSKRYQDAATALAAFQSIDILPSATTNLSSKINFLLKYPYYVASLALSFLSAMVIVTANIASNRVEHTLTNLAIAIIGAVVVAIALISAAVFNAGERKPRVEASVLAIGIPIILVIAAALLLGLGGAVIMTAAVTLAEAFTLAYVLVNQLQMQGWSKQAMTITLLLTIGIGIATGLGSILIF
jgi:serine/threonine protein kinase